jgi:WD40 repeat protein
MKIPRLATLMAAAWLGVGASAGGDAAIADETYRKTSFYLDGVAVTVIAFSRDGARIAFATEDRHVRIRETTAGKEVASLAVQSSLDQGEDYIHFAAFSPDGMRLVTASGDRMVRLLDIADGREVATLKHPSVVRSVLFSPDGTRLATVTGDKTVRLFDVAGGRELAVLEHPTTVDSAVFSPDGARLMTAGGDGTAQIWDVASGREVAALEGHADAVRDARFSPDGARVVTASNDSTARIWDAASGRELVVVKHAAPVLSAAFSPDGTRIVTGAGKEAHVFDTTQGHEIAVLKGHEAEVLHASFSPDGARIVTASADGSVRVWDAGNGDAIAVLTGHTYGVEFAAFTPDGQRILTVGGAQGIVWSRLVAASLPEGVAGLWFVDSGTPGKPLPPEIVRAKCVTSPISIRGDGLVVVFNGPSTEPPHPFFHMRCASDLVCQTFSGAPAEGLEPQGTGKLAVSGSTGSLCVQGDCHPIAHCPALQWTDEERKSGFAERWEAGVRAPPQ